MTDTDQSKPARIGVREATAMFAREGVIVSEQTVRRMAKGGKLDAVRPSPTGPLLIDPASVKEAAERKAGT